MRHTTLLVTALALLVLGITGLAVVALLSGPLPNATPAYFPSKGQRIYYTGTDASGAIQYTVPGGLSGLGMMNAVACVGCHGVDGRGGRIRMMNTTVVIPDIRYSVLTSSRTDSGTVVAGWTDADIARAIRDGVEPDGQHLQAPMPRWNMSDSDLTDLIDYLKELDKR
jgi:cytochrome c oxidase subunit 2